MKVIVSVGGRFHAFYLAHHLQIRGALERLITSYPRFAVRRFGVETDRIVSLPLKEAVVRLNDRLPQRLRSDRAVHWASDRFDRAAARRVGEADLCVAWSGMGLHTLRAARRRGALTVLERCSSHIEYQRDVLREEYALHGMARDPVHPAVVEKELREYEEADRIAVPSGFVRRSFVERGVPEEKLLHIPYGVDLSEFYPLPKSDRVFRVISVGTQSLRKGTPYLVRAFAELGLPDAELLLVGPLLDEVRPALAAYEGRFRHVPPVRQSELVGYYAQADVFALCSVEEGMAYVQAQAMACGLPVVCTTNTGGDDIVRDGVDGFVLPIRDVGAIKEKILHLYENREACSAMGESARRRALSGLSWDDYGERAWNAYRTLVDTVPAGGRRVQ